MLGRFVAAVRRNHGLEHAAVTLLLSRFPGTRMVGRASTDGFYLWGKVTREQIEEHVHAALARMKGGERSLAVTPYCGTNLLVAGAVAGGASMLALGPRRRADRIPRVVTAATVGLIAAQPLGRWVQERLTTSPDVERLEVVGVRSLGHGIHKVDTRWTEPE